ncbi:MAG: hypothetical protein IPQ02_12135 [Saprospiraceae bacterium]|nr:hypothetical protein [Candidatus Defluviibacterium haderslevense]
MFSPLGRKDKIWTFKTEIPYELNLITGEWTPLDMKFGKGFLNQVREEGIWKDDYTGETYISCFREGLVRYYPKKDTFDFLEIHPVTAFYSRKNNIVLGTANGLYFLNRIENKISVAKNFPLDIWVNTIQEAGNDTLFINYRYYYHITSNTFGEKNTDKSTLEKNTNYNDISVEIKSKLPDFGGGFREIKSDSISWYYRKGELFYSINKIVFYKFTLFPQELIRHVLEDKDYLYIMFNEQFVIFNKEYIVKNSIIHDVSNYQELRKELMQINNSLDQNKMSFDKYLENTVALYNDEKYSCYPDLQNLLENIPKRFEYYNYEQRIDNLNSILNNDTIPIMFKYNILKGLCIKYTTSAKLDSAMIYFNMIKELCLSCKDYCIDYSYPCVVIAYNQLDSFRNVNASTDKLIFFEAKAREQMIHCSCWFGDSWINYAIVEEKYQEILTHHPNSEFADDAEYWMINHENNDDGEVEYTVVEISKIRKFVNKYPNSEFIPELLMKIAYSHSNVYTDNIDDRIKNLDKGIEDLRSLKNNYQLDSLLVARVEQNIEQFEQNKNKLIYTLTLVPLKIVNKMDEYIEIEITISNNSSTPKTLELYKNECYVTFGIFPDKKVKFTPLEKVDSMMKNFTILRGKPLKQKIKLNSLVRHWDGGKLGKFSFENEGLYSLSCYSTENRLSSDQVKIYIEK